MAGRPFRFAITRADFKAALSALKEFFRYWPTREEFLPTPNESGY